MIDFAKYAFNKSHAAAYAVVSYQTAYLKYYYPREFMAALMTSVMDNSDKVAGYIYACRQMGIQILPPDVNAGEGNFSVDGDGIRYGLAAIKSVGIPVIEALVKEREENGKFKNLKDFVERMTGKGVNKRTIESFIKAGALDTLGGTRKQFMMIYVKIVDQISQEKKYSMTGQMSLFDIVSEEEKQDYEIQLPDVGEYEKETMLAFEKEVLGIYVSGHPMERYEEKWRKNMTATTLDFQIDEETGRTKVRDGQREVVGGMITGITIKHTKTNKTMAFLALEDMLGTVEIVVFPKDYEKYRKYLQEDTKVFVRGRVSEEDDNASKLICEGITAFEEIPCELWVQFADIAGYQAEEKVLMDLLQQSTGNDQVVIYCAKEKAIKRLPVAYNVQVEPGFLGNMEQQFGKSRVKVVEKHIEKV